MKVTKTNNVRLSISSILHKAARLSLPPSILYVAYGGLGSAGFCCVGNLITVSEHHKTQWSTNNTIYYDIMTCMCTVCILKFYKSISVDRCTISVHHRISFFITNISSKAEVMCWYWYTKKCRLQSVNHMQNSSERYTLVFNHASFLYPA